MELASKRKTNTRDLVRAGILSALIIVMTVVPYTGYINYGLVEITTLHIVVAVGAVMLGWQYGAVLGFVIPLSTVIQVSYQLSEAVLWGAIALVVQIAGSFAARVMFPKLTADVVAGKFSAAIVLAGMAVSLGVLQAACWTP